MVNLCCICKLEAGIIADVSFHIIPKQKEIKCKWLKNIGRNVNKYATVCSKHFEEKDFYYKVYNHVIRRFLLPTAVPSILLTSNSNDYPQPLVSSNVSCNTDTTNEVIQCNQSKNLNTEKGTNNFTLNENTYPQPLVSSNVPCNTDTTNEVIQCNQSRNLNTEKGTNNFTLNENTYPQPLVSSNVPCNTDTTNEVIQCNQSRNLSTEKGTNNFTLNENTYPQPLVSSNVSCNTDTTNEVIQCNQSRNLNTENGTNNFTLNENTYPQPLVSSNVPCNTDTTNEVIQCNQSRNLNTENGTNNFTLNENTGECELNNLQCCTNSTENTQKLTLKRKTNESNVSVKRHCVPRFIGDLSREDFTSETSWKIVCDYVVKSRKNQKTSKQTINRLHNKIQNLQRLLNHLKQNQFQTKLVTL